MTENLIKVSPALKFPRTGADFMHDLTNLDTKREPIISELLYEGDVWMLAADSGAGKSTIVTNILMSLSSAYPLFGVLETRMKRVYMLQTEGDYEESVSRIRLMNKRIPIDGNNISWDCFKFLDLNVAGAIEGLTQRIKDTQFFPEVIIIDPIYKLTSLDISEGPGALQVVKLSDMLKETFGATIILIHHNTKDSFVISDGKRFEKKDAYYGHSFIKNHIRTSYSLSQEKENHPTLTRKKGRGKDSLDKIALVYDSETMTCQMEIQKGSVLDRIKVFAATCKLQNKTTDFNEVQTTCGLSVAYLRKYKAEGTLDKIFTFEEGKQGRQEWVPI